VAAKEAPSRLLSAPAKATKVRSETTTPAAVQQRPTKSEAKAKPLAEPAPKQTQLPRQTLDRSRLPSGRAPLFGIDAPDLTPSPFGSSYCDWMLQDNEAVRTVSVKVENLGTKIAVPMSILVSFGGAAGTAMPFNQYVYAGASKRFEVIIPESCYGTSGSCSFQIELDHSDTNTESNEYNNVASGSCNP